MIRIGLNFETANIRGIFQIALFLKLLFLFESFHPLKNYFMFTGILHTHKTTVIIYFLIFTTKVILLLMNKKEPLQKFRKKTLVIGEMIIPLVFIGTGIYLAMNSGIINVGNWFWIKIGLIALIIPIGIVAFRKENKMLAVLGWLLFIYVYGMSETKSPIFKNPMKNHSEAKSEDSIRMVINPDEMTVIGNIIYNEKCSLCHGDNGKKMLSGAPDLSISTKTHSEIVEIITNGKNSMIPYRNVISEQEIDAAAYYVATLKKYAGQKE